MESLRANVPLTLSRFFQDQGEIWEADYSGARIFEELPAARNWRLHSHGRPAKISSAEDSIQKSDDDAFTEGSLVQTSMAETPNLQ